MAEELTKEIERLKAENAALLAEKEALKTSIEQAKESGFVSKPIEGTFTVQLETPQGKKVKKTFRFKPGRIRTPLKDGIQVGTEALIRIANGGKATEAELAKYRGLHGLTKGVALARLQKLAQLEATFLEEVK